MGEGAGLSMDGVGHVAGSWLVGVEWVEVCMGVYHVAVLAVCRLLACRVQG